MNRIYFPVEGSSSDICTRINKIPANQYKVHCYNWEGQGVYVESAVDPKSLKLKLQRELDTTLGNHRIVKK